MIIQCDHCSARFKMDDSKLANGPVKVRCAKCKEIFVVQPEEPAPAAVIPPVSKPVVPTPESSGPAEFSFDTPDDSHDAAEKDSTEFSFDSAPPSDSSTASAAKAESSNEFDWQAGAAATPVEERSDSAFDLSAFNASLDSLHDSAGRPAESEENNDFDFGEVDLTAGNAPPEESPVVTGSSATDDFSLDFGEVSFSDHSAERTDSFAEAAKEHDAVLSDTPAPEEESAAADDFLRSFKLDVPQAESGVSESSNTDKNFSFSDFSFAPQDEPAKVETTHLSGGLPDPGAEAFAPSGSQDESFEEELPPASLTSRKKGGSLFPLFVIAGAILLIVALAGSGVYFFGGPKAFAKVGLGFLVEWYGDKGAEEGSIALKGVTASYTVNNTAGEMFVVRGEAVNNFKKPRASIQIKVNLLGAGGTQLVSKSAYCGNSLSNEQLATLPLAKIEEVMSNQFGDSLTNLGLKPGAAIPFVVVVSPLPKEATDYSVVVNGSTVATQ